MTRAPLLPVERQLYHFLLDFLSEHTFQPSVREIAKALRIPSTKSVTDLLASLERKGYVEREAGRSRGVTLVGFAGGAGTMPVPVMRAEAGDAEPTPQDHITLDRRLLPTDEAYLVRAEHEAAPSHGVRLGDLVLVDPAARARDGEVVVVRTADGVLVRAMARKGATLQLAAPGLGDNLELGRGDAYVVLGVLAGVFRPADRGARVAEGGSERPLRSSGET